MTVKSHRQGWLERRRQLESQLAVGRCRSTPDGLRRVPWYFGHVGKFSWVFAALGLGRRGARNAGEVHLHRLELSPDGLPEAFDGFTIMFLSDLHMDLSSMAVAKAARRIAGVECDVAVFGGDFQSHGHPSAAVVEAGLAPLVGAIRARHGIFGVLGNHDRHDLVEPLERAGISLLINETMTLTRAGQSLTLVGCDDTHVFHDLAADRALVSAEGFRVAVVHSPDFAPEAAAAGCSLYLAGHTHGGQICLPGGRPILTALDRGSGRGRGVWRQGGMIGYTTTGLGCGGFPVRLNCPPEVALITLRRAAP